MRVLMAALLLFLVGGLNCPVAADEIQAVIAVGGKAKMPVVVAKDAPARVRKAAQTLADYLERLSGGPFELVEGDGRFGLAVGRVVDFPALKAKLPRDAQDPAAGEDYRLRSHPDGLHLLGATEQAVDHAVWDLLYRLGHRQFFPGPTWEVVPRRPDLRVSVDVVEQPSYSARRIWYGYGPWDYNGPAYRDWCAKNRATSGIELRSGHAYDGIYHRNQKTFDAHPEYLGLVGKERRSKQFCISNPDLRQLVVDDALAQLRRTPTAQSISMEPADGGGWCECEKCRALGQVSDRALTLANEVARAVRKHQPGIVVGMYAYNEHSPPPTIKAEPNVVVSVATAFVRGGYTVDQLLDGWHGKGATLGIREYYSVNTWDRDLPGAARAARVKYVQDTIPQFHAKGARFFSAESSDNWGPNGLGYYLASRLLWDVREAKRTEPLIEDFLAAAFGPANEPMARFYRLIDGGSRPLLSDDLVGRMYRTLAEARQKTDDPAIHRRLDDLLLYTRFVERWMEYANAAGPDRQAAFEQMIRHAYRMRKTMMVHTKALYRDVAARDKSVAIPKDAAWDVPEAKNPWKSSATFSRRELDDISAQGIAARKLLDFQAVSFGKDLVPADRLGLPEMPTGSVGIYSRGTRTYHTWTPEGGIKLALQVTGGRVYKDRGKVELTFTPASDVEGKAADQAEVAGDGQPHEVTLKTPAAGLHRIDVNDKGAGTEVGWPAGTTMTLASSPESPASLHGRWSLYFYVPKGTRVIGGFASGPGLLRDGSGAKAHVFEKQPGYFSVPVPAGQDGKLWKFENSAGQRLLMTVPPYLARNGRELLLPADVVARDAAK